MFVDTPATIAILGAGPIGLEAAVYARYLGYAVEIFERGRVCENVLRWGHCRMFSPFRMNASPLGLAALTAQDENYSPPGSEELLTGREWAQRYLLPLAQSDLLADAVRENTRVVAVGRSDCLKGDLVGKPQRAESPFRLLLCEQDGSERVAEADVVIDTTGTYGNANELGRGGIPAIGERQAKSQIEYELPDVLGTLREKYAGRHTLVVGCGYSAATSVVALAELADQAPGTKITWITRNSNSNGDGPIERIQDDRLPARDEIARRANELAAAGSPVQQLPALCVEAIQPTQDDPARFEVWLTPLLTREGPEENPADENETPSDSSLPIGRKFTFDNIIANVGYRPDASIYEQLHVHQCYASEGPMKLAAALLGETSSDCLAQASHGPQSLVTTEPNYYILGSKSYGRNSHFLVSIGLAQIRELFTLIAGRENLDLYATMQPN